MLFTVYFFAIIEPISIRPQKRGPDHKKGVPSMFKILTDNGADLDRAFLEKNDVGCMYLSTILEGRVIAGAEKAGITSIMKRTRSLLTA